MKSILTNREREVFELLLLNKTTKEIAKDLTGDVNLEVLDEVINPKYESNCSKEKMERALISVGKEELKNIIAEDGKAEIVCHFCNKKYVFNEDELRHLLLK